MKNYIISTTRQWNCGDEFILFGVLNIIKKLNKQNKFNTIIYNRNPSVRPTFNRSNPIEKLKSIPFSHTHDYDNSFHFRSNNFCTNRYLDTAICAGTPEWHGRRCEDFYTIIEKEKLPFIYWEQVLFLISIGQIVKNRLSARQMY